MPISLYTMNDILLVIIEGINLQFSGDVMEKDTEKKDKLVQDFEEKIDWELALQLQINELSCLAENEGIQRPGIFSNGRRTSSKLIYPVLAYDAVHCPYPTVIGLILTGLQGKTIMVGLGKQELPLGLKTCLDEILEFEGMAVEVHWKAADVADILLEARIATILLPEDVMFARQNGWVEMMALVRQGERSTHRLVVAKMGRMALAFEKQKKAYKKLKEDS